jgi:hypothetical protein
MKKVYSLLFVILFVVKVQAQCSTASLNWDGLDFFPTTGYTGFSLTSTLSPNQTFAFGKARLNITYSGCTSVGENASHTGSTSTYGTGDDVQFSGNGTVTLNFSTPVTNVKFSVYDIDKGQNILFSASNSGSAVTPTITKASASSTDITITGSNVKSSTGNESEGTNTTSINVDVADPVTSITMTVTASSTNNGGSADSDFWLSDIEACVSGSYTSNYYHVVRPFTGMPGYVLAAVNKGVYMVNTATGVSKLIFTDGATSGTINSLAYDPVNKVAYYCWSLTNNGSANASEKTLRKYDFTTGQSTTVVTDINSINVPTLSQGVESGAAAFYDGSLYIGIEGGADNGNGGPRTSTSNRESIIWRIDFNASGTPTTVAQVYGVSGDSHDWSDFSINNGILYDFNGDASTPDYHHINLQTGAKTRFAHSGLTPRQSCVGWDGTIFWLSSSIAVYNQNGSIGTQTTLTASPAFGSFSNTGAPSFGDGAEAFRPAVDFGDAPSTFDPDALAPAVHEVDNTLRLGSTADVEWDKATPGVNADVDGSDEDGLVFSRILINNTDYQTDVRVFNNTGANATLCAWIDFNNDGVFQASEGITRTISSTNTLETVNLVWSNPSFSIANNSYTYLRIRITSAANGMTTSNPTGYFANGEVEDYRILVSTSVLTASLKNFSASPHSNTSVKLNWQVAGEEPNTIYELQHSKDGQSWMSFYSVTALEKRLDADYQYVHNNQNQANGFYRLKIIHSDQSFSYSKIRQVAVQQSVSLQWAPNPASSIMKLTIIAEKKENGFVRLVDLSGKEVYHQNLSVQTGDNVFSIPVHTMMPGIYKAELWIQQRKYVETIVVKK